MSLLILLLAKTYPVPEKRRGKRNLGELHSFSNSKIVFTLLIKVVAVHVGFLRYTFGKRVFSFSWSALEITGVEAKAGVWVSKMALKIYCKLSSEYSRTLIAATGMLAMKGFVLEGSAGWSKKLLLDSRSKKKSRRAIKRAKEGVMEGRFRWGRPRPQIEVILELIFF